MCLLVCALCPPCAVSRFVSLSLLQNLTTDLRCVQIEEIVPARASRRALEGLAPGTGMTPWAGQQPLLSSSLPPFYEAVSLFQELQYFPLRFTSDSPCLGSGSSVKVAAALALAGIVCGIQTRALVSRLVSQRQEFARAHHRFQWCRLASGRSRLSPPMGKGRWHSARALH